ncbi:MAG: TspO/MBR family protein [Flavobacteriales bacterium]
MVKRVLAFLFLNFLGLAIGGLFTNEGVVSEWYANLNKAPWTPPGWVFGAAWTIIMICFSFYLAKAWGTTKNKRGLASLYTFQWLLNVGWNPLFFYFHEITLALLVIITLAVVVGIFIIKYLSLQRNWTWLMIPYFLWLLIAISLNAYVVYFF